MKNKIITFLTANWLIIILAVLPPTAIWYFFQRETYALKVIVATNTPMLSVGEEIAKDIKVFYKSREISTLNILDVQIVNAGNKPIQKNDFDTPINLTISGQVLSQPSIVRAEPASLSPTIQVAEPRKLEIQPLLLNNGDSFVTRIYVSNLETSGKWLYANARIKNIRDVDVVLPRTASNDKWNFLLGIIASLLSSVSVVAILTLFRRARLVVRLSDVGGIVLEVSKRLEAEDNVANRSKELAKQLDIKGHDYKSNFLLLRLKIESLLREISRSVNLPSRSQFGSISRIAVTLEEMQVIPHNIAAAIRDLSPALNKELHDIDIYVTEKEFEMLQHLGLNIVAELDSILKKRSGTSND